MYLRAGVIPPASPTLRENAVAIGKASIPVGTPTNPTTAPGLAASNAVAIDCVVPTHSSTASAPIPSVRSRMRSRASSPRSATRSVAPNSLASACRSA